MWSEKGTSSRRVESDAAMIPRVAATFKMAVWWRYMKNCGAVAMRLLTQSNILILRSLFICFVRDSFLVMTRFNFDVLFRMVMKFRVIKHVAKPLLSRELQNTQSGVHFTETPYAYFYLV